ncbi:MAG: hypothetical protein ACI8W7_000791 [Gammaproteobacteria bacterium]
MTASATCEGERKGVEYDPFIAILGKGGFFTVLTFEFKIRRGCTGFYHALILCYGHNAATDRAVLVVVVAADE